VPPAQSTGEEQRLLYRTRHLALVLLAASCGDRTEGKPQPSPEQLTVQILAVMEETVEVLAQVTDRESADRLGPKLAALSEEGSRLGALDRELKRTAGEAVEAAYREAARKHLTRLARLASACAKETARIREDPEIAPVLALLREADPEPKTAVAPPAPSTIEPEPPPPRSEKGLLEPLWTLGFSREDAFESLGKPPYANQIRERGQAGHYGPVSALCQVRDRLVSAAYDQTVLVWQDGKVVGGRVPAPSQVSAIAYHPGRNQLVCALWDRTLQLWDATTLETVRVYRGHEGVVSDVAWSPDGAWFASCSWDETTRVWDPDRSDPIAVVRGHDDPCFAVAVSPDGQVIATASTVLLAWNVAKRHVQYRRPLGGVSGPRNLAFTESGEWLLAGTVYSTKGASVLDARTGDILHEFPKDSGARIASCGPWIVTARDSGRVTLWRGLAADPADVVELGTNLPRLLGVVAFADGRLSIAAEDTRVFVYKLAAP
jgi:hypothetical protein